MCCTAVTAASSRCSRLTYKGFSRFSGFAKFSRSAKRMPVPSVSVDVLLRSRTETFGLPLELLAGGDGLGRLITSPHIQKTGLALAGFHEYLKPGRVLIFGESEIRYLESLETPARSSALRLALTLGVPCVVI